MQRSPKCAGNYWWYLDARRLTSPECFSYSVYKLVYKSLYEEAIKNYSFFFSPNKNTGTFTDLDVLLRPLTAVIAYGARSAGAAA